MPSRLVGSNVVIVARYFNPSVFSQLWLVRNGVVEEDGFLGGCLFSDEVVKVETRDFGLLVIPPQLQFQPRVASDREADLVASKVGSMVRTLLHTPYAAVGLNFAWHVWSEGEGLHGLSRSLFLCPSGPFAESFGQAEDALFGGYFSKDTLGCRLRLDVKPLEVVSDGRATGRLLFSFNYQLDTPQDAPVPAIERQLQRWQQAKTASASLIERVETHLEKTP
jgi:hypothetical protein